jgi:hypothetical protein
MSDKSDNPEHRKLTTRQERFVKNYLKTGNGSRAARESGYSKNCASVIAAENLTKPNVLYHLRTEKERLADKVGVRQESVLRFWYNCMSQSSNPGIALKASEFLARYLDMFNPEESRTINHESILRQIEDLSKNNNTGEEK